MGSILSLAVGGWEVNLKETVEDRQETEDDLLMDLQGQARGRR